MTDYSSPANAELPALPDDDADFTPDLARKIIAKYQELLRIRAQCAPWRPIETAPKDGSRILICREDRFPKNTYVARWLKDVWSIGPIGGEWHAYPTHWMPLPAGPSFTSPECTIPKTALVASVEDIAASTTLIGIEPQRAPDAGVLAITFAVEKIEDHYDRLEFLTGWLHGDTSEWPEYSAHTRPAPHLPQENEP